LPAGEAPRAAAQALADQACAERPTGEEVLRQVLAAAGVHDAQVTHCLARAPAEAAALAALQPCLEERRRAVGATQVARAATRPRPGQEVCAAAVLVRHLATLAPVPTTAAPFATVDLEARLEPGATQPEWLLMDPRGRVERLPAASPSPGLSLAQASFHAGPGRYVVQLMVTTATGPEVASQATTRVGRVTDEGPARLAEEESPDGSAGLSPVERLHQAIRLHRSRQGLPAPARNPALQTAAAQRLERLMASGQLLHVDRDGRDIAKVYLEQPGAVPVARIAELLAAGPTPMQAFEALLGSPGHRRHLDDPTLTESGVAAAPRPVAGEWLVVVALSRPLEGEDGPRARLEVLGRLNDERSRHGLPVLTLEPNLVALASAHAAYLAHERALKATTQDGLKLSDVALRKSHATRAGVQLYRVTRPAEVSPSPSVLDERFRSAAVGLRMGTGVDGLYVVVILLEP
jgi:uncharacterized protein YkwD